MPRAIDPSLPGGGLPLSHDPLNRIQYNVIPQEFDLATLLAGIYQSTLDAIEDTLFPAIEELTGIDLSALLPLLHLIDLDFSSIESFFTSLIDALAAIPAALIHLVETLISPGGPDLLATTQGLQDVIDTIWQAITRTTGIDNLLDDLFDSLQNIPGLNVLGVLGPSDIGASIRATIDQLVSGLVGSLGTGASLADVFNISQDVSSRSTLGLFSWDILGIRNNKSINTGFLPTGESNISLDKVALQSSAPTFALTQSTAITAFQRISEAADKAAVSWMGSGVTNVTSAFVNIFKMDPATGLSTLVHASADIVGLLSGTMQHNVYTLPTALHVEPGEVYGIEVAVRGAGTHSIVGASTWLPDHPTVFPRRMSAVRNSGTSAAPSTIAHSSLTYSTNVPFVEFAVSAGDTSLPHSPVIEFYNTVGTVTRVVPSWANTIQVITVGAGGGGRQGGTFGLCGEGGAAGVWATGTWLRGAFEHFTGSPTISITISAGGAGGSSGAGYGAAGGSTTVSIPSHTVTAAGGDGGTSLGSSSNLYGRSPGNQTYDSVVYAGGAQQNTSFSTGSSPGGGGSGGNSTAYQHGGAGARGGVWLRFKT